jgi:hypothetical protein
LNEKHLLWHIFNWLGPDRFREMFLDFDATKTRFSDNPQSGEIAVSHALRERYDAYLKASKND